MVQTRKGGRKPSKPYKFNCFVVFKVVRAAYHSIKSSPDPLTMELSVTLRKDPLFDFYNYLNQDGVEKMLMIRIPVDNSMGYLNHSSKRRNTPVCLEVQTLDAIGTLLVLTKVLHP